MPVPKFNIGPTVVVRTLLNIYVSFSGSAGFKPRYKQQGNSTILHRINLLFVVYGRPDNGSVN